jgi:hypothetical protein
LTLRFSCGQKLHMSGQPIMVVISSVGIVFINY